MDLIRSSGFISVAVKLVVCVVVVFVILKGFGSIKKAIKNIGINISEEKSETEINNVLKMISDNNVFKQQDLTRQLGSKLASVSSDKIKAEKAYNNAIKNDPPWYLEWKDGILWWDKKRTTGKTFEKCEKNYNDTLANYKSQVAKDTVLQKSKKLSMSKSNNTLSDGIKVILILLIILLLFKLLPRLKRVKNSKMMCSNNEDNGESYKEIYNSGETVAMIKANNLVAGVSRQVDNINKSLVVSNEDDNTEVIHCDTSSIDMRGLDIEE